MNIEQAKAISIVKILETIGIKPTRLTNHEAWYLSPLRDEKTASFKVNLKRNQWYDFGTGIGGDTIKFVCSWLESCKQLHSVSDALKWLKYTAGNLPIEKQRQSTLSEQVKDDRKLVVKSVRSIKHKALIHYLQSRGIPITIADRILKEVRFQNTETGKNIFALGLQNEESGWELRNPFAKLCIGPKHITFLRGKEPKPEGINLFEGFMDYLSILTQREGRPFKEDTVILNSLSCIKLALPYMKGYGYKVAFSYMDNDQPGKKATQTLSEFFKTQEGLQHRPMNNVYGPYKDVNAWHMHTLGL